MKRTVLYCIVSAAILFVVAFIIRNAIAGFYLQLLSGSNLELSTYTVNGPFKVALKVSAAIGVIPFFLLATWISGTINSFRSRLFSVLIVLVSIAFAIMVNVFRLLNYKIEISPLGSPIPFSIEEFYFEYAIFIGVISGSIIAYLLFRKREAQEEMKAAIEAIGN